MHRVPLESRTPLFELLVRRSIYVAIYVGIVFVISPGKTTLNAADKKRGLAHHLPPKIPTL